MISQELPTNCHHINGLTHHEAITLSDLSKFALINNINNKIYVYTYTVVTQLHLFISKMQKMDVAYTNLTNGNVNIEQFNLCTHNLVYAANSRNTTGIENRKLQHC